MSSRIGGIGGVKGAVVQVLHSGETREVELVGTRSELLTLGRLLLGKAGSCELAENQHPSPYERSLSEIVVREDPARDTVSLVVEGQVLRIRGGREALDLLADNIEGFAQEADAHHHCHVDFPTYHFVDPESDSLVIVFPR